MTLENKTVLDPELLDVLAAQQRQISRTLNCVKPGRVQSFDRARKTATVQILLVRVLPDNTTMDYPVLVDCPVVTIQGGGGSIQFPIEPGDQGLLLFCDRNIDAWFKTGSAAPPADARSHDLSDGFFLCGVNSLASALDNYVAATSSWRYDGAEINLSAGLVAIKNGTTSLLAVIAGLIDVIEALEVVGPIALTPAAIASLEAYKAQVALLLAS